MEYFGVVASLSFLARERVPQGWRSHSKFRRWGQPVSLTTRGKIEGFKWKRSTSFANDPRKIEGFRWKKVRVDFRSGFL